MSSLFSLSFLLFLRTRNPNRLSNVWVQPISISPNYVDMMFAQQKHVCIVIRLLLIYIFESLFIWHLSLHGFCTEKLLRVLRYRLIENLTIALNYTFTYRCLLRNENVRELIFQIQIFYTWNYNTILGEESVQHLSSVECRYMYVSK
jgi:hypothetical protein